MDWVLSLLRMILEKATPEIRESLVNVVKEWEQKALATPNKVDDIFVWLVKYLLMIE